MNILVLNGPNLNILGKRNPKYYGNMTLAQINKKLSVIAREQRVHLIFFQSNHEGAFIDCIQKLRGKISGILINPGALTHYGYSLRDALEDSTVPIVEVHLSDITMREDFREIDIFTPIVVDRVMGHKEKSYEIGLKKLIVHIKGGEL